MQISKSNAANSAIIGIYTLLLGVVFIVCLYLGKEIFIPFAVALLLSFFLSQFVTHLEKWLGRVASVFLVVLLVFIGISITSYIMTVQLIDLAVKLPDYKTNIESKLHAIHLPQSGIVTRLFNTIEELKNELPGAAPSAKPPKETQAVPVQVIDDKSGYISTIQTYLGVFISELATAGLVLLLVFFMLINREDLRGRLIRLMGQGQISSTTRALDDASNRISHYLFMQLVVNVVYGILITIGLSFLGIPNAILWGGLAIVLRFIPYIGAWLSALLPIALSLAISTNWAIPLMTLALYLCLELIICNVIEPWLYGSSTGVSPMALMVAAVFWTWLWGPIGLILSTPLTACLVVMGHHVTKLEFLRILLSSEQPLTPDEEFYYRVLSTDQNDSINLIEAFLKQHSVNELYDLVLIPVLTAGATDRRLGLIDVDQSAALHQSIEDIIEDLSSPSDLQVKIESHEPISETNEMPQASKKHVLCLPARAERDELVGAMLTQLLGQHNCECENLSSKLTSGELIASTEKSAPDVVYISTIAPSTIIQARYLCTKLRQKMANVKIYVIVLGQTEFPPDALQRLRSAGANEVVFSLTEGVALMDKIH